MKCQNKKYYFTEATEDDGEDILKILEEPDFKGDLSIVYTRRPNPIMSFKKDGEKVLVLACKLKETNELIGFGCCSIQNLYVGARKTKVGYLSGLRVKKKYRMMPMLLVDAYGELIEWVKEQNVTYLYTTVLDDNKKVQKMFEKKRKIFPHYIPVDDYTVYCSSTRLKKPVNDQYTVKRATTKDVDDILKLNSKQRHKYDLYPALNRDALMENNENGLDYSKFYIARKKSDDSICACAYVLNQQDYKQHIIYKYGGIYKILKYLSPMLPYIGYPKLPREGSVLEYYTLSYYSYEEGHVKGVEALIKHIASARRGADYFLMGMTKDDELNSLLSKLSKITYKSKVYMVDYIKTNESSKIIDDLGAIYLECGRL